MSNFLLSMMNSTPQIITSINNFKKKAKCTIYINNEKFIDCSSDLIFKYKLIKGEILTNDIANKIKLDQRVFDLKQAAYKYASYKVRTKNQVHQKLKSRGYTEDECIYATNFLTEFGLLNDKKYAESFVRDYIKKKPSAPKKLLSELYKRGIARKIAESAIQEIYPIENELELALLASEKKIRAISYKSSTKQKNALISHLQRLGFPWEIINQIIQEYFPE